MTINDLETIAMVFDEIKPLLSDFFSNVVLSYKAFSFDTDKLLLLLDYSGPSNYKLRGTLGDSVLKIDRGIGSMGSMGSFNKIEIVYTDRENHFHANYSESSGPSGYARMNPEPPFMEVA